MQEQQIHYKSANLRKQIAVVFMIIMIVISIATTVIGIIETSMFSGGIEDAPAEMMTDAAFVAVLVDSIAGIVWLLIFIGFAIIFLMWLNRVYKNLIAASVSELRHSPGWAVGWYFIPIANLFKPYIVMREIYLATMYADGSPSWKENESPGMLLVWWWLYVLANVLLRWSPASFDTISDYKSDAILTIITEPMMIISGVCLIRIMNKITKVQNNDLLDRMNQSDRK